MSVVDRQRARHRSYYSNLLSFSYVGKEEKFAGSKGNSSQHAKRTAVFCLVVIHVWQKQVGVPPGFFCVSEQAFLYVGELPSLHDL